MDDMNDTKRRGILAGLLLLPFKLVFALVGGAFRLGWWTARLPVRVTAGTTRAMGFKGLVLFVLGAVVGLLAAPMSGAALRDRLRQRVSGAPTGDAEVAEKVRFELAHAPRTWHLPQPEVTVVGGRVTLTGSVPHEEGRDELVRVTTAVPGVAAVDDQLAVSDDTAGG
jgi:hypothetical protein